MLSKEIVEARFGHMPVDVAEGKSMVKTLIAEMQTEEIVQLIAKIKSTKNNTKWFLFGIEVAELELTKR